jgi:RNA polymerase subunit RPABC4/transcription elongation factor Spt4
MEGIMFCGNCGKEIEEGTKFCTKCGWTVPVAHATAEKPEDLRCSVCGTIIKESAEFCGNCGNKINTGGVNSRHVVNSVNIANRMRHGFTSFWLIFGIIICSITGLFYLLLPNLLDELNIYMSPGLIAITGIATIVQVVGLIFLLKWKKIGFWIIIGVSAISLIISLVNGGNALQIIGAIIGIAIYWGVLQIKKNGKTTWEQLD